MGISCRRDKYSQYYLCHLNGFHLQVWYNSLWKEHKDGQHCYYNVASIISLTELTFVLMTDQVSTM